MTMKLGEQGEDGKPAEPSEVQNDGDLAAEILSDPKLPAEDFARARTDSEFMSGLISKRRSAPPATEKTPDGEEKVEAKVEPEVEPEKGPKKKGPRRGGYRRQVEKLHDDLDATKRENDRLRAQLAAGPQKTPFPGPPKETPMPKEDDFESHVEYLDARSDWKAEQKVTEALKKRDEVQSIRDNAAQHEKAKADLGAALYDQSETARKAHKDYQEKMDEADDAMDAEGLEWSNGQAQAFAETGQFGEIAYYLGQHTEEAVRLAKISNRGNFMRALGKLEARIEAAAVADPKEEKGKKGDPPTPLKTPVEEVVKGGGSGGPKDAEWWSDKATPQEYAAARKKRQTLGTGA